MIMIPNTVTLHLKSRFDCYKKRSKKSDAAIAMSTLARYSFRYTGQHITNLPKVVFRRS